jgi:hypothetical protein
MFPTKAERFYGAVPAGTARRRLLMLGDGDLSGVDPGVKLLQEELGKLASQTGNSDVMPDRSDGTMSLGTIMALAHAASVLGSHIDPTLGKALDVVNLLKKPLEPIPYADQVIGLVLSPWIIDNVFDTVLSIMRIIPGAGSAADAARHGVDAFEAILSGAASSLTAAMVLARKALVTAPSGGFHGYQLGITSIPASSALVQSYLPPYTRPTIQVGGGTNCAAGQYRTPAGKCVAIPACPGTQRFIVATQSCQAVDIHDHTAWPPGKAITPAQWSKSMQYRGKCALADLAPADQTAYAAALVKAKDQGATQQVRDLVVAHVRDGLVAFRTFNGADGTVMGAFFSSSTSKLSIVPLPTALIVKKGGGSLWGNFVDAVDGAIDMAGDALGDVANATGDFLADVWSSVGDQVIAITDAVIKYGCAIVGSDLVVAIAAAGVGLVATPAASAAVVSGAAAGRTGCAVIDVGELVYAILKLLSNGTPTPPPPPPPPEGSFPYVTQVIANRLGPASSLPVNQVPTPIVLPLPVRAYPPGSIARFNTTRKVWSIYSPLVGGLGCACRSGIGCSCASGRAPLGAAEVNPPVPFNTVKAGEEITPPAGVTQSGAEEDKSSIWKNPYFWLAVGGGVVGAGSVLLVRRRRKAK